MVIFFVFMVMAQQMAYCNIVKIDLKYCIIGVHVN
jgi:hypothetical protein